MTISIPLEKLGCSCDNYLCVLWCGEMSPSKWPWEQCQGFIPWTLGPTGRLQSTSNLWCVSSKAATQPGSARLHGEPLTVLSLCAGPSKGCGGNCQTPLSGCWEQLCQCSWHRAPWLIHNLWDGLKIAPAAALCFHDSVAAVKVLLGLCIHFNTRIYKSVDFSLERAFCQCKLSSYQGYSLIKSQMSAFLV